LVSTCQGIKTFTGTADGRTGTAQFWNVFGVDFLTGFFSGHKTAIGGTGELANLLGQGTFEGLGTTGNYTFRTIFAP
jgi:hypothetical protein